MRRSHFLVCAALGALSLATGALDCKSNPLKQPTVTVASVESVFAESKGFVARVHATAHNPNAVPLPVRRVQADISVSGQDAADIQSTSMSTLAPNADTPVVFDVAVPWKQLASLASRSGAGDPVPYTVSGTAWAGVEGAEVSFPFTQSGSFRRMELFSALVQHGFLDLGRIRRQMGDSKP